MGNMNIHIGTGPKCEYSYNLANLRENWAQKKNRFRPSLVPNPRALLRGWGLGTRLFPAEGVHAMNKILTKWRIALSIDIGVLENH